MSNWTVAEVLLGLAAIALMLPQEDALLIPRRRDWLGGLRRFSPAARRRSEEAGAREADQYVAELHGAEPGAWTLRAQDLPSTRRPFETVLLTEQTPAQARQRPPWDPQLRDLIEPQRPAPSQVPPRRAPRNAPTIVTEVVRPNIENGLAKWMRELEERAGYPADERKY